jgi:hypothetical protein
MKYVTLAAALAVSLLASDAALARGRRGGCPGGNCHVYAPTQKVVQAPVQKGQASPSDQPKTAEAEPAPAAPQPQVATTSTQQRTRRFAAFSRLGRRN